MNMNPFQMITGMMNPMQMPQVQAVMQRASQMAQQFQNPQMMIQNFFPDAPMEVRNDPNNLLLWLQQTGRFSQEQINTARQMMNGR